jgi:dTDP-4-dehydrorhamnose reductase
MKILLFGGSGQLGYDLIRQAGDLNFEIVAPVTSEVDITDRGEVSRIVRNIAPSIVINSAAYTAVDKAEEEPERAHAVNALGAELVAEACNQRGIRLIHISTDYVFDGEADAPLKEDAPVNPINVYGRTKLEGERAVLRIIGDKGLVVRTASLYGQRGANFVGTMLKLFGERERVSVVADQWMSPTWTGYFAEVVLDLCRIPCSGVLHAACEGAVSWFTFAEAIARLSSVRLPSGERAVVEPTTAEAFSRPARRPRYSALDCGKLSALLGRPSLHWEVALKEYLQEIGKDGS